MNDLVVWMVVAALDLGPLVNGRARAGRVYAEACANLARRSHPDEVRLARWIVARAADAFDSWCSLEDDRLAMEAR